MHYTDSIQLPYPCRKVYEMVGDIERYPEFLPGWRKARILVRQGNRLEVEQELQAGPAVFRFHSSAHLQACSAISIISSDGPFRDMRIDWRFSEHSEGHCQVMVEMALSMRPGLRNSALKLLMGTGSGQLLPLFEQRARILYT